MSGDGLMVRRDGSDGSWRVVDTQSNRDGPLADVPTRAAARRFRDDYRKWLACRPVCSTKLAPPHFVTALSEWLNQRPTDINERYAK